MASSSRQKLSVGSFLRAVQERKVLSVAGLYLVVGYGLVEASEIVFPRLQLPVSAVDWLLALVLFAFPVTLLASWLSNRDTAASKTSLLLPIVSLLVLSATSAWLGLRVLSGDEAQGPPLVVMMDSHHPARVYDEETLAADGTNADTISDILLDLPIRRQRESIGPEWRRDEEILQFDPDLIVIHYSGFRQEDGTGPRERLKLFISYFEDSDTRFLIYSRNSEAALRELVYDLLSDLSSDLISRVDVFGLDDYGPGNWKSPLQANQLKLRVKDILGV